jgi:hypothetical protein
MAYKQYNISLFISLLTNVRALSYNKAYHSKFKKIFIFALFNSFSVKQLTLSTSMKRYALLFSLAFIPILIFAQDEPAFGIKFSGFVKTDILWDSRQTVDIREGHFLLYPKNEYPDPDGNDINAKASFNFLSIQTRLRGDIKGPDALGAKTSGAIEGEFFGMADGNINGFRLRHAYVKLNWKATELMVGQFWHPMFITSCYPEVVSFNTGAPFLIFSRNPQIRLTQDIKDFRVILAALSQIDFKSPGPGPEASNPNPNSKYLRNSAIPSLNINLEYSKKNAEKGTEFLAGIAGNFKRLIPRLETVKGYKTTEGINSVSAMAYLKIGLQKVAVKVAGLYGQNMFDYTMIGGYAMSAMEPDTIKGFETYENISTFSTWLEVMTTGKKMQGGLFLGYSKNLGSQNPIDLTPKYIYSRGSDIAYLYRISPRFIYNAGKFRLAPEIEYTVAGYGKPDSKDIVDDIKAVGNFRFLLGVYYFF